LECRAVEEEQWRSVWTTFGSLGWRRENDRANHTVHTWNPVHVMDHHELETTYWEKLIAPAWGRAATNWRCMGHFALCLRKGCIRPCFPKKEKMFCTVSTP
jgi:hypothetical protein